MSTLFMVRHGQARFGTSDYDRLSELGFTQSRVLGEHWAERGMEFDAVYSGAQQRQKETLTAVGDMYRAAGLHFPEPSVIEEFNEYDATGIMTYFFPKLLQEDARLQVLIEQFSRTEAGSREGRKAFQQAFNIVMNRWIEGDTGIEGVESWEIFKDRVVVGIKKIMAEHPTGNNIAVFSSGGPISASLQHALGTTNKVTLDTSWVVKNSSISEFRYNAERFSLIGFNMTPHFNNNDLLTYR